MQYPEVSKDFYFLSMLVGCFEQQQLPSVEENDEYMPYRGPGHLNMQMH